MDGAFACPECGSSVEVGGLAPGRHVRCGFCDRLLEVPFLPRAVDASWKRRRFARHKWLGWAWVALAVAFALVVAIGAFQWITRQYQSAQQRSINRLLDSARDHESVGRLDQALLDLDTALEIAQKAGPRYTTQLGEWRKKRAEVAVRDAQNALDLLGRTPADSFVLGNWLNLVARAEHDPDLSSLRTTIDQTLQGRLDRQTDFELAATRTAFDAGRAVAAMTHCDKLAGLFDHITVARQAAIRKSAEELVIQIVSLHGVKIDPPRGTFLAGPQSYTTDLVPVLVKGLEAKEFVPYKESSPWRHQWTHALYRLKIDVTETRAGTYLSSGNRLSRIEVRLTLAAADKSLPLFQTMPSARSRVPLPKLPVYLSSRVASADQSAEIEKLLYDDARGQIDERLAYQLQNMPSCPTTRTAATR
jgi:hypothetical protein